MTNKLDSLAEKIVENYDGSTKLFVEENPTEQADTEIIKLYNLGKEKEADFLVGSLYTLKRFREIHGDILTNYYLSKILKIYAQVEDNENGKCPITLITNSGETIEMEGSKEYLYQMIEYYLGEMFMNGSKFDSFEIHYKGNIIESFNRELNLSSKEEFNYRRQEHEKGRNPYTWREMISKVLNDIIIENGKYLRKTNTRFPDEIIHNGNVYRFMKDSPRMLPRISSNIND